MYSCMRDSLNSKHFAKKLITISGTILALIMLTNLVLLNFIYSCVGSSCNPVQLEKYALIARCALIVGYTATGALLLGTVLYIINRNKTT